MKKYLRPLCLFLLLWMATNIQAQISAGGGIGFDTELKRIGFTGKLKYVFSDEKWAASPSYNIYPSDGITVSIIDLDAHYHIVSLFANDLIIYGLAGIGFVDTDSNKVALNGGFGTSIPTNSDWNIFAEVKFRVNKITGTQIGGGVLYEF